MKSLSRQEVKENYIAIIEKYGKPTNGEIYCIEHLMSAIAHDLCAFDETHITFEYGRFEVSPNLSIVKSYSFDHTFIGTVKAKDWYTTEQLRAMHEIAFGYMF